MKDKTILEFAKMISGIFSNKEQALENPKNFAHIQIHFRPLFIKTFKCYSFYSEQRYQHDIWNPYKQGINKLSQEKGIFVMSNHKIENKERFTNGAIDFSLLNNISKNILNKRIGCSMHFRENNTGDFIGNIEPGRKCYIQKGKERTYLSSKVKLTRNLLLTEDSGYEEKTAKKVWGSNFGPLIFKKIDNFDYFIEQNWE